MTDWEASDWILHSWIEGEISNDGDTVKLRANDSRREPAVSITVEYADVLELVALMQEKQRIGFTKE